MGQAAAGLLRAAGYNVAAWARTPRPVTQPLGGAAGAAATGSGAAVPVFAGRAQLRGFVEQCDVLVCLLPLTPETQGAVRQHRACSSHGSGPSFRAFCHIAFPSP